MKKICDTILDAIGDTPLVRINSITHGQTGYRSAKPGNRRTAPQASEDGCGVSRRV
jgi:hypothetical protein